MATYTLPFAWDSQFGGIPPGDQGRTSGKWFVNGGGSDFGRSVFAEGDGREMFIQTDSIVLPRMRFAPNAASIADLIAVIAGGTIISVTMQAVHRRQRITFSDTAPISVAATIERPANTNLTTVWSVDVGPGVYFTQTSAPILHEPAGGLWTPALILATEFSLSILPSPINGHPYISQYYVDLFNLIITYETQCVPFPMPTVGGAGSCSGTLGTGVLPGTIGGPV